MIPLFFNHVDAWGATLVIGTLVLMLHDRLTVQHGLLVGALGLGYWLAFALNDYFDAPYDAHDRRKAARNYFVGRQGGNGRFLFTATLIATAISVVFASYGWLGMTILALGLFIMWAYSAPPLRLKNRPGLDLLTHTIFVETFPYTVTMILIQATWQLADLLVLTMLALASLTAQLEQQLRDFVVDAASGGTFSTWAGPRATAILLRLSTGLLILLALISTIWQLIPLWLVPFGLIALPAMAHRFLRRRSHPRSERLILASVAVGLCYMLGLLVYQLWF